MQFPMDGVQNIHFQNKVLHVRMGDLWYSARPDLKKRDLSLTSDNSFILPATSASDSDELLSARTQDGTQWMAADDHLVRTSATSSEPERIDGRHGLPVAGFTCLEGGGNDTLWAGTDQGLVQFRDGRFSYRQGRRWLPDDRVLALASDGPDSVWIATPKGLSYLHFKPMTWSQKAEFYENQIDQYIKRTKFGYVSEVTFDAPGNPESQIHRHPSDNDGLWTSMYGAGECFAYAATKQPRYRKRARAAFDALKFLVEVPRHSQVFHQEGFVARTVLESTLPDPNLWPSYTLEGMQKTRQNNDGLWKVYSPRWPISSDGQYYYKTDTSSDELDGHYFFYALYHDLVADSPQEKKEVEKVVCSITDHLIRNDFCLVDHDGTPTRWAVFSPDTLNNDPAWFHERGLNSLSMLTYLTVASHISGDTRYDDVIRDLIENHHFLINASIPKIQSGIGSGNQSDDEMAFMNFYSLIRLTNDPGIRDFMTHIFYRYWVLEYPEMNPFFNFCYAAVGDGRIWKDQWGEHNLSPWNDWLEDSIGTLIDFPLDRFNWGHRNSHRLDIHVLPPQNAVSLGSQSPRRRGYRTHGKVLPVSERSFNHWNTDPWTLDYHGSGSTLGSGTVFLLPYYMGLYHNFISD